MPMFDRGVKRSAMYAISAALIALTLAGGARGLPSSSKGSPAIAFYAVAEHKAPPERGPCDEPRWLRITPKEWTPQLVKGLIRCTVKRWPVEGGASKAIAVFTCESGLYPGAVGGDNLGIAQHKARYWVSRVRRWLHPDWFNRAQWKRIDQSASVEHPAPAFVARANVIVAIRMVHSLPGKWIPWRCA